MSLAEDYEQEPYETSDLELLESGLWPSKNGAIPIERMSDDHIRNCLKLIGRKLTQAEGTKADCLALIMLKEEQKRRRMKKIDMSCHIEERLGRL